MRILPRKTQLRICSLLPFTIMVMLLLSMYGSYWGFYVIYLVNGTYLAKYASASLSQSSNDYTAGLVWVGVLHVFIIMWLWTIFKVMKTNPGTIPRKWNSDILTDMKQNIKIKNFIINMKKNNENKNLDDSLDVEVHGRLSLHEVDKPQPLDTSRNTAPNPSPLDNDDSFEEAVNKFKRVELKEVFDKEEKRYCYNCHNFKPDRTHHCAQCNKCILKMDHHCLWIMNCVGFYNYKYFVLFLFYTNIILSLVLASTTKLVYDSLKNPSLEFGELIWLLTFYTLCLTILVILVFFLGFHVKMIINNKTTIEHCESKDSQYDTQSIYKNVCAVLGTNPLLWLIPARPNTTGEGISFPKKEAKALKTLS